MFFCFLFKNCTTSRFSAIDLCLISPVFLFLFFHIFLPFLFFVLSFKVTWDTWHAWPVAQISIVYSGAKKMRFVLTVGALWWSVSTVSALVATLLSLTGFLVVVDPPAKPLKAAGPGALRFWAGPLASPDIMLTLFSSSFNVDWALFFSKRDFHFLQNKIPNVVGRKQKVWKELSLLLTILDTRLTF